MKAVPPPPFFFPVLSELTELLILGGWGGGEYVTSCFNAYILYGVYACPAEPCDYCFKRCLFVLVVCLLVLSLFGVATDLFVFL